MSEKVAGQKVRHGKPVKKYGGHHFGKQFVISEHAEPSKGGIIKVKWVVSAISCTDDMRATIKGLGLRRMHHVVERQDTPETRGMIHKVRHLVEVVD
jgi:large subunit ribosomal protein L30